MSNAAIERVWTADGIDSVEIFHEMLQSNPEAREHPAALIAAIYSLGIEVGLSIADTDIDAGREILRWTREQARLGEEGLDPGLIARYVLAASR